MYAMSFRFFCPILYKYEIKQRFFSSQSIESQGLPNDCWPHVHLSTVRNEPIFLTFFIFSLNLLVNFFYFHYSLILSFPLSMSIFSLCLSFSFLSVIAFSVLILRRFFHSSLLPACPSYFPSFPPFPAS